MKPILVTLVILWPILLYSQQNKELISNSGYQASAEFVVSASLGQSFVHQTHENYSLSEGFQQYFENEEYIENPSFEDLIYPNPTTNHVTLKSQNEIVNLRIYNDLGALIKTELNIFQIEYRIQLNPLKAGVYLFEIEYGNGLKSVKKIIKI